MGMDRNGLEWKGVGGGWLVGWLVVYLLIYQCDVLVVFPVVAAASTYCTYCYLFSGLFYLVISYFTLAFHISHFTFNFPVFRFFLLHFSFAFFFLLVDLLVSPFSPNQPTNQPTITPALGHACLQLPQRLL